MSIQHQPAPVRASSVASHVSATSGRESKNSHFSNGSTPGPSIGENDGQHDHYSPSYDESSSTITQTPQPPHPLAQYPNNPIPSAYLPPLTSSPPLHAPAYIPPPQHAMSPDPIHGMIGMGGQNMMGGAGMPWQTPLGGPGGVPPGWRPGSGGYPGQPGFRGSLPNGHGQPISGSSDGYHTNRQSFSLGGPSNHAMLHQTMLMNGAGRPGSALGDVRERRQRERSHHRDEDRDLERDSREEEVISTIFVVGFPDDMSEREFQNVFTFAPGFEAATLKFPSGSSRSREPTATLLAELQQLAAAQQAQTQAAIAAGEHPDLSLQGPLEEALAALQLSGTATTSSSTTPSAAMSLTPSAPSGPTFGSSALPQLPTRRQTIGFARFKSRADAIAAKEQLQGRKIDSLTGATLKAEMAKKNLHTKRSNPGEELVGMLLRTGKLAGLVNAAGQQAQHAQPIGPGGGLGGGVAPGPGSMAAPPPPGREAWESWPQSGLPPPAGNEKFEERYGGYGYPPNLQTLNVGNVTGGGQNGGSVGVAGGSNGGGNGINSHTSSQSSSSTSPPLSITSPNTRPIDSKALLALAEEADELEGWTVGGAMGMGLEGYTAGPGSGNRPNNQSVSQQRQGSTASISVATGGGPQSQPRERERSTTSNPSSTPVPTAALTIQSPSTATSNNMYRTVGASGSTSGDINYGGSPPGGSDQMSERGLGLGGVGGTNPADQNPPINTLYVGNLPAISPPTHPPNFLEESLRNLFSRCAGYKRMSFRQKINGPMCFVEFEDIPFAAQAIQELYGHNLHGLVKGGIRLSYSKNSLGQRGNSHPAGINTSLFGGIAHTVALAGMSSPSANNAAYGLQLQQGPPGPSASQSGSIISGGPTGPQSAPIPMPGDLRRGSDSTSLSPTAQPFNASLPVATSPRSRYFGTSPGNNKPDPISTGSGSFPYGSASGGSGPNSGSGSGTNVNAAQPIPTNPNAKSPNSQNQHPGQFSPVSSPIRTPASYSWVSSGNPNHSVGNGGYGFDPFSPHSTGLSLSGAASAWQQGNGGTPM